MLYILDPREKWVPPVLETASKRGWSAKRIFEASDVTEAGHALLFVHAHPDVLKHDRALARALAVRGDVVLLTDLTQTQVYEDKRAQTSLWRHLMPQTWVTEDKDVALGLLKEAPYPLISKADVGASSYNVRLLKDYQTAQKHVLEVFNQGVSVEHCDSKGTRSLQKGYVILQEFIPHDITYRVNVIGDQRAVFQRYCFPDRPMAQTGNVSPTYAPNGLESLLDWSVEVARELKTKWCALDVLNDHGKWVLLETSLRWPWPSPGDCMNGRFFLPGWRAGKRWAEMFDVLFDELEAGAWANG